jgi:hypothetical protein
MLSRSARRLKPCANLVVRAECSSTARRERIATKKRFWCCTIKRGGLHYNALGATHEASAEAMAEHLKTRRVKSGKDLSALEDMRAHFALVLDSVRNPDGLEVDARQPYRLRFPAQARLRTRIHRRGLDGAVSRDRRGRWRTRAISLSLRRLSSCCSTVSTVVCMLPSATAACSSRILILTLSCLSPFTRQRLSDCNADPRRSARNQRPFADQLEVHGTAPLFVFSLPESRYAALVAQRRRGQFRSPCANADYTLQ